MTILEETKANFEAFYSAWSNQCVQNWETLHSNGHYLTSYRRIAAFQALKVDIILKLCSPESAAFFQEAHNDALVSHVSASHGAWRTALKSLRSLIENSLASLYYADHPIELRNWQRGKKRTTFPELIKYFEDHPSLEMINHSVSGLNRIKSEYATLSKAVHGSAVDFRMTDNISNVMLWSPSTEKLGKWSTREKETISGVCQLVISLFAHELTGAKRTQLRESLGFVFGPSLRNSVKAGLNITIPSTL